MVGNRAADWHAKLWLILAKARMCLLVNPGRRLCGFGWCQRLPHGNQHAKNCQVAQAPNPKKTAAGPCSFDEKFTGSQTRIRTPDPAKAFEVRERESAEWTVGAEWTVALGGAAVLVALSLFGG